MAQSKASACFYCEPYSPGWVESGNNGPIFPCPFCNPKTARELEYDRAEIQRAHLNTKKGLRG